MPDELVITIDNQTLSVPGGVTILKAAQQAGISIPTICYHDYCTANGLCRMCVVEVEGARTLLPACIAKVAQGMKVSTRSERVIRARRTILEMLASSVDLSDAPEIQVLIEEYHADPQRFPGA